MTDTLLVCPCSSLEGGSAAVARHAESHGVVWVGAYKGSGEDPKQAECLLCGRLAPHLRGAQTIGEPVLPAVVVFALRSNHSLADRLDVLVDHCLAGHDEDDAYWAGLTERMVSMCAPAAATALSEVDPEVAAVYRLGGLGGVAALAGAYPDLLAKLWKARRGRFA